MSNKMWVTKNYEYVYRSQWITVRKDTVVTNKNIEIDDFYVLEYPTWVNVIAITEEGKYIIEHQYRHGLNNCFYELCAGICNKQEDPLQAAKRELLEETGYGAGEWSLIGKFAPNPNTMNNWCYSFLANGLKIIQAPKQELTEDIDICLYEKEDVLSMMRNGMISEGIMLAPLWQYFFETTK